MPSKIVNSNLLPLFDEITKCEKLIFACGTNGISANIVGKFKLNFLHSEDRLDCEDGTNHIHIDWGNIQKIETGNFYGEGVLTFQSEKNVLFKLYNPNGNFSEKLNQLAIDFK
ncbi:MAG: hypothetical protein DWQ06_12470 [Calditrichaeota bacterium]|nr:MAG: hypothetical protein DWQ06_12470 [Calditrichota bacterium]